MKKLFFIVLLILTSGTALAAWERCENGITWNSYVTYLRMSGSNIFAGTYQGGVFLSTDFGDSWTQKSDGITNDTIRALTISGNRLYAGTPIGIFLSTNNGDSWTPKNTGLTGLFVRDLKSNGNDVWTIIFSVGPFLSTNNGEAWEPKLSNLTDTYPNKLEFNGNTLVLATSEGMYLSNDNGENWIQKNTGLTITDVRSVAIGNNNIYAGTQAGGVFVSTDNGESWTKKSKGLTGSYSYVYSLCTYDKYVFAGTLNSGIFFSSDNGDTWTKNNSGITGNSIGSLTICGNYIFAGTDRGLFRSKLSDFDISDVSEEKFPGNILSISPNPFSESTTINYELQTAGMVKIDIFSSLGEKITTLVDEWQEAGRHKVVFDVGTHCNVSLQSGIYFYRIQIGERMESGKIMHIQ